MKNLTLLVVILVFAVSCAGNQQNKQARLAEISYSYGTQALMEQDYSKAIGHLSKAAELDPKNPEVHNNLGMAFYFKGERELARQHITRALELDENNTDARSNLGSLAFEEGNIAEAERIYLQCLKDFSYDKQARVYLNLALIELRRGNSAKATGLLKSSVKEDENYCPAWFQLGQLAYKRRDFKDAMLNFKNATLGKCATDPAVTYWQALTMIETREYLNARMKLDDISQRFPTSPYAEMAREKISQINLLEQQRRSSESSVYPARETSTPTF